MGTILVGMATPQQFEDALAAVQKGPLPAAALDRLSAMEVISPIVVAKLAWASSTYGSNVHFCRTRHGRGKRPQFHYHGRGGYTGVYIGHPFRGR
jgi:hypothetical protein